MTQHVKLDFNPDNFGQCLALQVKLQNAVNAGNRTKVAAYLVVCRHHWPDITACPIDRDVINSAVRAL